jgi:translocation and assembly module TamA
VAAFVDAGDAFDDWSDADIAVGYGIGARLRTPIGPIRLDVAYGEREKNVRLHFSVGLSF